MMLKTYPSKKVRETVWEAFLSPVPITVIEDRLETENEQSSAIELYSLLRQYSGQTKGLYKDDDITLSEAWRNVNMHRVSLNEQRKWLGLGSKTLLRRYKKRGFRFGGKQGSRKRLLSEGPCCNCEQSVSIEDIVPHAWLCELCLRKINKTFFSDSFVEDAILTEAA